VQCANGLDAARNWQRGPGDLSLGRMAVPSAVQRSHTPTEQRDWHALTAAVRPRHPGTYLGNQTRQTRPWWRPRWRRGYKKVQANWPQGPERSFAARRLHSTAMYLGTATATATVPTSRLLATPAHPHACFSSCSLGSLNSLSLKHRVPISLPVVAAGGDRHMGPIPLGN
jgi:hypothetical protein